MSLRHRATIIPLVFFLAGSVGITVLYRIDKTAEYEHIKLETSITAEQVRLRLEAWVDSRAALVSHLAGRQFEDTADVERDFANQAQTFIDLYPGIQALNFVDRQWIIRIVVPTATNAPALGKDLHDHPSPGVVDGLARASSEGQITRTPIVDLLQGGKGIATYCRLVSRQGKWLGYINGVFRVRELIDSCLYESALRDHFSYRLTNNDGDIAYRRETEAAPASDKFSVVLPVRIVDREWNLRLYPKPSYRAQYQNVAGEGVAGMAILLLASLAFALRMLLVHQEALRESRAKYRLMVENQVDMVIKLDPEGCFLYASPSYCETFDCREDQLLGTSFLSRVHADDQRTAEAALTTLQRPPYRSYHEQRATTRDGTAWHAWTSAAILDSSGNLTAITALGHDITRRLELEDQLSQSRKMQAVGQLAGGIAHDFNNLLQSMLGNLQFVVEDTQPTGQTARDLSEVESGIKKAVALTRQLLAFGSRQDLEPKSEDLNNLVTDAMASLKRRTQAPIALGFTPSERPVVVRVDRGQAEKILHNLCDNARKAIGEAGTIDISIAVRTIGAEFCRQHTALTPGDYAALSVADDGRGMSPEVLGRAFEPFYSTREVGAGTGLGLATSYGIVQQHGGTILAESKVGHGSTFTVLLPLVQGENVPTTEADQPPVTANHETILLAEDDVSVRELAVRVLQGANYTVLSAADGKQAIELFSEHRSAVDLVVLDMIMPLVGGRQARDAIVAMHPTVPILFASGYDPATMTADGDLPDGADMLMKPYGISDLLVRVREILDRDDSAGHSAL